MSGGLLGRVESLKNNEAEEEEEEEGALFLRGSSLCLRFGSWREGEECNQYIEYGLSLRQRQQTVGKWMENK